MAMGRWVGIALGVVVVGGLVSTLVWKKPWIREDVIVKGRVRSFSLSEHSLVAVVDDLTRAQPEQPIYSMNVVRVEPGKSPVEIVSHIVDVRTIVATRTHVFLYQRSVIGHGQLLVVPITGGTPTSVVTSDDVNALVAYGDHAWFTDQQSHVTEVAADGKHTVLTELGEARCLAADAQGLIAVTPHEILQLSPDHEQRTSVAQVRVDMCEVAVLADEIILGAWSAGKSDGVITRISRLKGVLTTVVLDQGAYLHPRVTARGILYRSTTGAKTVSSRVLVKPFDDTAPAELVGGDVNDFIADGQDLYFTREDGSAGLLHRRW